MRIVKYEPPAPIIAARIAEEPFFRVEQSHTSVETMQTLVERTQTAVHYAEMSVVADIRKVDVTITSRRGNI